MKETVLCAAVQLPAVCMLSTEVRSTSVRALFSKGGVVQAMFGATSTQPSGLRSFRRMESSLDVRVSLSTKALHGLPCGSKLWVLCLVTVYAVVRVCASPHKHLLYMRPESISYCGVSCDFFCCTRSPVCTLLW
jgi:hypothetical protein